MLLGEFRATHDFTGIPQVDWDAVRILTVADYWDGPLSGLIDHAGELYWYESYFDEELDSYPYPRRCVMARISVAASAEELKWNRLFREKVRNGTLLRPGQLQSEYYAAAAQRTPNDFASAPITGWFCLGAEPAGGWLAHF
ncbi:hypothetical protein ACFP81_04025 [Deinococcus lacus]|uniref:Uncharacterized protein n=1 Tax=Deinococcus lacus TaxID=392561 RepID=A0ABW1YAD7_9DEIO